MKIELLLVGMCFSVRFKERALELGSKFGEVVRDDRQVLIRISDAESAYIDDAGHLPSVHEDVAN